MAGGPEVADVFRRHGPEWRAAQAGHLDRMQRRVMGAIEACRTAALGGHMRRCADCGHAEIAYNSCRNRHCPKCQGAARAAWVAARQAELLPVPYFHVVFTLPAAVGAVAFQNKAVVYGILFRAATETLRLIAADPRHLGAEIGGVAVLHSWGQAMQHHPHVHCIVPGGGLSPDRTRWIVCPRGVRRLTRPHRGHGPPHSCRSRCWAGCSGGSSFSTLPAPSPTAACASPASSRRSPRRTPSPPTAPGCGRATGSSSCRRRVFDTTPSARSGDPSRCWPISDAIPIAACGTRADARCHRQQPARRHHRRQGQLPLEGLPPRGLHQGHDPRCGRVHAPVSAPCPATGLPPHPALRLHGQRSSHHTARPMPPPARGTGRSERTRRTRCRPAASPCNRPSPAAPPGP